MAEKKQKLYYSIQKKTRNLASEYERRKAREDPNFRIARSLRSRIRTVLRIQKARKSSSLYEIIGCSKNELKKHLESLFKTGMSWDNYGKWHIDHIKPCNSFNLIQEEEQKKAFNYKNLQPLWELENLKKSDKWEE